MSKGDIFGSKTQADNSTTNGTSSQTSNGTTTANGTQVRDPYAPAVPYLNSLLPAAQNAYNQYGQLNGQQQTAINNGLSALQALGGGGASAYGAGQSLLGGQFNYTPQAVGGVSAPTYTAQGYGSQGVTAQNVNASGVSPSSLSPVSYGQVSTQAVDPVAAFASLGRADPTDALVRSLSGSVDNPYLNGIAAGNVAGARQQYGDLLEDQSNALNFTTLPGIRSGANLAGQYGGTRQGVAEGIAQGLQAQTAQRAARDLTASTTATNSSLFGGAYESAQDRAASVGTNLAGLSVGNANSNADRSLQAQIANSSGNLQAGQFNASQGSDLAKFNAQLQQTAATGNADRSLQAGQFTAGAANDASQFGAGALNTAGQFNAGQQASTGQFNANLGLQNNTQGLAAAGFNAGNLTSGASLLGAGQDQTQANTTNQLGLLGYAGSNANTQLQQLYSILGGVAGLGGTTNSNSTTNTLEQLLKNYTENKTGTSTGSENPGALKTAATVAQIASLFSDSRLKENIRRVGVTDGGLPVYTYRYKGSPVTHMGVMAQEVEAVTAEAVTRNGDGFLMVDYAKVA